MKDQFDKRIQENVEIIIEMLKDIFSGKYKGRSLFTIQALIRFYSTPFVKSEIAKYKKWKENAEKLESAYKED